MSEYWKDIKGFDGLYQVSNLGNVRGLERVVDSNNQWGSYKRQIDAHLLKNVLHPNGYYRVDLCGKLYSNHRLVAEAFIYNDDPIKEVNHKNGIKTDNTVENLEWVTKSENIQHADRTGLRVMPRGKDSKMFGRTGATACRSKKVICLNSGEEYGSAKLAAEVAGIKYKYFAMMLSGRATNKTSYVYKINNT